MTRLGILGFILLGMGFGFLIFENWDMMIFSFIMSGSCFLFSLLLCVWWTVREGDSE